MKITIINSSSDHPINERLNALLAEIDHLHDIQVERSAASLTQGDLLFIVSCTEKIPQETLARYKKAFVLHASDLPEGKGWSPHVWAVIEGQKEITLSMIKPSETIDGGDIWMQEKLEIPQHALWDEINDILFDAEIRMIKYAIENSDDLVARAQSTSRKSSYYPRRTPADSQIDPEKTIYEQFDLMRISDPNRFPAFFEIRGHRYKIVLEKFSENN